ncbi:alpha-amylase family glycosyl hydrolase [Cellvibrio japonicus]|uniref:Alpha-amylase, putative, amy13G n=1 Tax=Cellvibrio japonicus (strain Ueda107) TaxID=498211 RepID=B3PEM7_CELJU|nr:alpha-amylase family glycosyl hydrolase [Cellvibrio japonicus]ACE86338.1 alpha-amylase, putative, amy13G [Cellvibrio japonicus Ueda107]
MKTFLKLAILAALWLSQGVYADWYFRGTPNNWATTAMTATSSTQFTTCQTFGAASTNPRFKIDRLGDWSESYPSADYTVTANQSYNIQFNSSTKAISIQAVSNCDSIGFTQNFASLYFRGTPNSWGTTAMALVANNTWTVQVTFDGQANQRFKFDVTGNWATNYGDSNNDGVLNQNGSDIYTSLVGTYQVQVNDATLAYSLTPVTANSSSSSSTLSSSSSSQVSSSSSSTAADSWYFRGTPNNWGSTAMALDNGLYCTQQTFGAASTNPRFKIDHYANWTESYPSSDYLVSADTSYKICFNAGTKAITLTNLTSSSASSSSSSSQASSATSSVISGDFRSETIYFLLTARFYDGDANNNYYNRDRYKAGDPHWRGDFKGLIEKLDYIKDLGFTAIWVTPPVENRSGLDYHGYHAYDFYKVDPRLESPGAGYQEFINAAHAKGLKVIQDVVINHSSQYGLRGQVWIDHLPIKYYVPAGGTQGQVVNGPYLGNLGDYKSEFRDDNDNPVAPAWFRERHTSDAAGTVPLVDPKTGATVPQAGYNPNRFFGIDATTLDPNWYHQDGFMSGGDWESPLALQKKHMAGDCIDLATGRQNVKDYLNGAIRMYLDMGVDAIRIDTVKHVERNELLTYVNNWKAHKPGLFVFGENLVKGTGFGSEIASDNASAVIRPWWYTRTTSDPANPNGGGDSGFSVLDFSVFSTFRDNVTRGHFGGIGGVLAMDWVYGDATQLVTFFQNHDVGPDNDFKYRYGGAQGNAAMAYNLLWTNRGIPTLYYGEEIMFQGGLPQDIAGNNDTIDQTGRAYFGPHLDNLATTQAHPLYQHIKRLNQIRKAVPALQKAPTTQVNEWGAGMSFVRDLYSQGSYAVVGLASSSDQSVSVSGVRNGTYRDAVTGNTVTVNNGTLSFTVKAYSAGIYVLNGPGKIGVDGSFLR